MDLKLSQKKVLPFHDVLAIRPMSTRIYKNGQDISQSLGATYGDKYLLEKSFCCCWQNNITVLLKYPGQNLP